MIRKWNFTKTPQAVSINKVTFIIIVQSQKMLGPCHYTFLHWSPSVISGILGK